MFQIDRGPAFFCHGEKEIVIFFGGNRTRIAGLVGGRSPSKLAGPVLAFRFQMLNMVRFSDKSGFRASRFLTLTVIYLEVKSCHLDN